MISYSYLFCLCLLMGLDITSLAKTSIGSLAEHLIKLLFFPERYGFARILIVIPRIHHLIVDTGLRDFSLTQKHQMK